MATGGQEKGGLPDYDECPVCRECLRDPRILNCEHYFCRVCLEGIMGANLLRLLKCPACREVTEVHEGSGVTDLPRHEGKYSFQEQVAGFLSGANNTTVKRDCDLCDQLGRFLATAYCHSCTTNMCKECENKHLQKITSHRIVPLVDLLYCSTHPSIALNLYCTDCNVNICIKCALYDHDAHQTVDMDDVAKQSRQRLRDFAETQSDLNGYQSTLEHVMSALRQARKLETQFTDSIINARRLLKELETKLAEVERDTKNKMAAEIKTLSLYETDIKDMIDSRKSLVDHATYLVEQASDPELVEREKDFPRTRVSFIQNIDNGSVKMPVLGKKIKKICAQLERMIADIAVEFRKWNIGKSKILEIEDLQNQHTIRVGHDTYGVTMDTQGQTIVARTMDAAGPLKVYDYKGQLQESLGAGVTGLADGYYRGICMDTKRDLYMAPCEDTLVLVDKAGQMVRSIVVGSDNKGVSYDQESDNYLVSDISEQTVYLIDPDSSQVIRQMGSPEEAVPAEVHTPYGIHVGTVAGIDSPCIVVCDYGLDCIKVFDISGQHVRTYGSNGHGDGEVYAAHGVITDPRGRVVVCDSENNRVVSFSTDNTGRELWECVIHDDWGGNEPWYMALDTDTMVMVIADNDNNLYIYD